MEAKVTLDRGKETKVDDADGFSRLLKYLEGFRREEGLRRQGLGNREDEERKDRFERRKESRQIQDEWLSKILFHFDFVTRRDGDAGETTVSSGNLCADVKKQREAGST